VKQLRFFHKYFKGEIIAEENHAQEIIAEL